MHKYWITIFAVLATTAACSEEKQNPPKQEAKPKEPAAQKAEVKPTEPPKPVVDEKVLERGRYLTEVVLACYLCHTKFDFATVRYDDSMKYAGGFEFTEKFGTWRSPNITQDEETGIGKWTDQQIIDLIREGRRPDGSMIYPIMPYPYYSRLTDGDAKAVVAYLRTIKPIKNAVKASDELKLPKPPVKAENKPVGDTPQAKGEYLATLMHCHMCHTPMGPQGPVMEKSFAGGFEFEFPPQFGTGKVYSPNITSDPETGIGKWTEEQILASFTQFKQPDGRPIGPPMAMYAPVWSQLAPDDAQAIAAFIKSLPAVKHKVPKSTFKPAGPPPKK